MTDEDFALFLDRISTCFITGDFDAWEACIILPFSLVTKTGPVTLSTQDELRANFEQYLDACRILQLDTIARRPIAVKVCDDATVIGTYETQLLSRGTRATQPYTSSALLHRANGGWRMSSIMNALGHHHWTDQRPNPTGEPT